MALLSPSSCTAFDQVEDTVSLLWTQSWSWGRATRSFLLMMSEHNFQILFQPDFFAHLFFNQVLSQENKSAFNDSVLLELVWVVLVIHQGQLLWTKTRGLLPQLSSKCLNRKHILYYPFACFQSKSLFNLNKDFGPRALPCRKVVTDGNTSLKDLMDVGSLGRFWERIVYSSPELC